MNKAILFLLVFITSSLIAQKNNQKDKFVVQIKKVKGDLNKDNLADLVVVTQDTINEKAPYKVEVFFAQPNGAFKQIVSTTKAIDNQYPEGKNGYYNGNSFYDITIEKGILTIKNELTRGNFEHKFRYQNNNFELIGFSEVYSDGQGTMGMVDFNLSTGIRVSSTERYDDSNEKPTKTQKKILIRPLPKLQNFAPFTTEFY
ncbi:hypothetical protein OIU80_04765 [Flavobacterium sp. LS1R47]|uniref:Uncharacterized protein n=1 Tax=Flavobacterium frigoritolerans TaxID=2987686 RepID=A0A9X2ZI76_9FLAO|nr:hypothetical protein [Flavobacterium frigoritolerans]MCV9931584.1 hypothetical protein [Flavobacterium frigoritolerans]